MIEQLLWDTFYYNIKCLKLVEKPKKKVFNRNSNPYGIFTSNN